VGRVQPGEQRPDRGTFGADGADGAGSAGGAGGAVVSVLASVSTAAAAGGVVLAVLVGIALGLLAPGLTGRRRARSVAADTEAAGGSADRWQSATPLLVDDLPRFLEHPPGAPPPAPAVRAAGGGSAAGHSARSVVLAMVTTAAVLVALAVVISLTTDRDPGAGPVAASGLSPSARTTTDTPTGTAPTVGAEPGPGPAVPTTAAPATAPATGTAAGSLAFTSVPLGSGGVAASIGFGGVVLEQRAVGLTVTYPSLSLSTDGAAALAHVRLPTFNCLTSEPPADPLAAGCRRSLTEYADLAGPDLRVGRDGDRLQVAGLFPTYTRPNGSAPAYTGRAYQLTATVSPDGSVRGARAAATGVVRIGLGSAASTPVPGVNVLQFPG
jgi:hypothetical protein